MCDDLMAKEIEVDPLRRAAAFCATKGRPIKTAGSIQVVDWKSNVKRC